jgi:hypothetical protein
MAEDPPHATNLLIGEDALARYLFARLIGEALMPARWTATL